MHRTIVGLDPESIDISMYDIIDYGIFNGGRESLIDLVQAITYIAPLTWQVKHAEDGKFKVLFFNKPKTQFIDDGIEPESWNADVVVKKGEAWTTFLQKVEDDKTKGIKCGFKIITIDDLKDIMFHEFMKEYDTDGIDDEEFFEIFKKFLDEIDLP